MTYAEILETVRCYRIDNASRYPIVRLGVFGSVARNNITETSDVDIVVELDDPDLFMMISIKQELEELLHRPVDIVRYRQQMSLELKRRIEADAIYV